MLESNVPSENSISVSTCCP